MHRGGIIDIQSLPLDAASQQQLLTHKFSLFNSSTGAAVLV
jgi:hypothetical protein